MDIAYTKTTLANGLDVILHEDHTLPIVAVNVWYHVGSKDERPGLTGFAHLFEHLMFEGSAHHDHGYFPPLQDAGAAVNGSTNADRTNYWEVVPTGALELALFLESDRMGFLLPALTEKKFTTQREVVINERRQNYENRPYGLAGIAMTTALYPSDHPYHWPTIGYTPDLRQATLDDVRDFFARHYHPGNASIALAGDIDPAAALALVERYFGDLPTGPPVPRVAVPAGGLADETRIVLEDRVDRPRLYLAWRTPALFEEGDAALDVAADVIASGKTSRLYRTLVHERRLALDVSGGQQSRELEGFFQLAATAAPGRTLSDIEAVIHDAIARARRDRADRCRARAGAGAGRGQLRLSPADRRRLQRQVGSAERLQRLPRQSRLVRRRSGALYAADRRRRARRGPPPRRHAARRPQRRAARRRRSGARRIDHGGGVMSAPRRLPAVGESRGIHFPPIAKHTRADGSRVWTVEHRGLPVVCLSVLYPIGSAGDPVDRFGLTSLTADLLDEGTQSLDGLALHDALARLGSHLEGEVGPDAAALGLVTLSRNGPRAAALLADVACHPRFDPADFARVRDNRVSRLVQMRDVPAAVAERIFSQQLYGAHPYGHSPVGVESSLRATTLDDVARFHEDVLLDTTPTIMAVGDVAHEDVVRWVDAAWPLRDRGITTGRGRCRDRPRCRAGRRCRWSTAPPRRSRSSASDA